MNFEVFINKKNKKKKRTKPTFLKVSDRRDEGSQMFVLFTLGVIFYLNYETGLAGIADKIQRLLSQNWQKSKFREEKNPRNSKKQTKFGFNFRFFKIWYPLRIFVK